MTATMLTGPAFAAARRFIEASARPLEIARFHHAFDGGSGEAVFESLIRFQNADGGFGHALEPDLRTHASSALCTSLAFQVLRSTQAKPGEAFVAASIAYFLKTLDRKEGHWRIIPRSAGQSPHAPWWDQTGREEGFDSFSLNPTAEVLGYLYDFQEQVPNDILSLVSDRVINHLSGLEQIEMHELLCCLRLLQTKSLPQALYKQIRQKLASLIEGAVSWDPARWKEYSLRPLQVVDAPQSPFIAEHAESVAANLDYEIASQDPDGSWKPTWSWGEIFPDDWMLASREWAGVLTLEKLLLLHRFQRIEG